MKDLIQIIGQILATDNDNVRWHVSQDLIRQVLTNGVDEKDVEDFLDIVKGCYLSVLESYICEWEKHDLLETIENRGALPLAIDLRETVADEIQDEWSNCKKKKRKEEYDNDEGNYWKEHYYPTVNWHICKLHNDTIFLSMARIIVDLNNNGVEDVMAEFKNLIKFDFNEYPWPSQKTQKVI